MDVGILLSLKGICPDFGVLGVFGSLKGMEPFVFGFGVVFVSLNGIDPFGFAVVGLEVGFVVLESFSGICPFAPVVTVIVGVVILCVVPLDLAVVPKHRKYWH